MYLQKWLNLITAPGSVSNEPGSVTWQATKYLKTVSWRNHTEKLTTLWPQNTSFWPKINIPSSYFTILMLNCLENTPVWQLCDSCQILDLINFQNNFKTPNSNTAGISLDSRLKYSKITHRYATKLSIHLVLVPKTSHWYRFHPFYLSISPVLWHKCQRMFHGPVAPQQGMLGALIVWWPASFWLQWTMTEGTVHASSPAKFPTKSTEEWKKEKVCYKTN